MCRRITQLPTPDGPATQAEIQAAALKFVRKVSGFREPAPHNRAAFDEAVERVAAATQDLLDRLVVRGS